MGEVVEEFEETLARIHARHRDDPRRELAALLLLAMEREQLVSIAYRDELIHRRLATLSLAPDVREIFRHGIAWAWKDEEMHAIYTRGLLLRIGTPWTRGRAVVAQMAGAVAGWASSVRQHARWSACHWFGNPTERIEVVGCDEAVPGWRGPYDNEIWALLRLLAYPVYQFASGRGAAFIPRVDRAAFPPLGPPGLLRRGYGRLIRALVGLP